MPRAGFELAIPATKRPQTYALDRAATGIGCGLLYKVLYIFIQQIIPQSLLTSTIRISILHGHHQWHIFI
jgi:hypothetical protein